MRCRALPAVASRLLAAVVPYGTLGGVSDWMWSLGPSVVRLTGCGLCVRVR